MDEPTAALNAEEVLRLFDVVRSLREHGVGVLYISHRLDELQQVADGVVVLRDGSRVASHRVGDVTRDRLVAEIVGKELGEFLREGVAEEHEAAGEVRLELRNVGVPGFLQPMSFGVRSDQILGLYGLAGSGVEHVAQAIFVGAGATGEVLVEGEPVRRRNPARCRKAGLALVPADRRSEGLFPVLSVAANISITEVGARNALALVTRPQERAIASRWIGELDVRPANPDLAISGLSGGNQQKAIIGRWLVTRPRAFVLDEPTRGIDVGAKSQIYHLISNLAAEGAAVVVVSSDLPELMSLCTHIGVVSRGRLVGIYPRAGVSEERVVDLAIGGHAA
jgi:ABC-type sugar transport system ATPase subunit